MHVPTAFEKQGRLTVLLQPDHEPIYEAEIHFTLGTRTWECVVYYLLGAGTALLGVWLR